MSERDFEHIFKQHYADIFNFINHYVMDKEQASNLTQDVFISLFENSGSLPVDVDVKKYLISISKNRCISYFRHLQVEDRHALKYFESMLFTASSEYDTTYDELHNRLQLAMGELSPLQQAIIRMKIEDKNYAEMAEVLGVSISQIHKNVKKAYEKIRNYSPSLSESDNPFFAFILLLLMLC